MSDAPPLTLASGDAAVALRPEIGGAVVSFEWRGIDILRRAPMGATVRQMGLYPLVPYANRIGFGRLNDRQALRANFPNEPHSVHGFGWQRSWQVLEQQADSARLGLQHAADEDWPFDCACQMDIALGPQSLQLTLSLTNTGDQTMPAGLGFHPYFPFDPSTRLHAAWQGRFDADADRLPSSHRALPPADNLDVAGWAVDHCYSGWDGQAVLDYADHRTTLQADPACAYLHCFQPGDGRAFVALEPVSHIPNAHQLTGSARAASGLRQLEPGQAFSICMTLTASERNP